MEAALLRVCFKAGVADEDLQAHKVKGLLEHLWYLAGGHQASGGAQAKAFPPKRQVDEDCRLKALPSPMLVGPLRLPKQRQGSLG